MSTVYDPMIHTADEWRAMAHNCMERREESWERSDTDGFLSQWALEQTALLYRHLAELRDTDGRTELIRLADLDGNVLDAEQVKGNYGWSYRIWDPTTRRVSWFNESTARKAETRRANNAKKGYKFVTILADVVYVSGKGVVVREGTTPTVVGDYLGEDYDF